MPSLHNIRSRVQKARNFYFPEQSYDQAYMHDPKSQQAKQNLSYAITRIQFFRIRQDIQSWRRAVTQAEEFFFPYRTEMQRIYMDTVLNEHVAACMKRRKNLTLLRDYKFIGPDGQEAEDLKAIFYNNTLPGANNWFMNFLNYALDAIFFGYSLIYLNDLENNAFPHLGVIRRENVSPDRMVVASLPTIPGGVRFDEKPWSDWHIWVPTPGETGRETCGYGLLYKIAKAEIYLRNNMGFNADYNELFAQPLRVGKTTKTNEDERGAFENALKNMGSSAYILLDEGQDDVTLVEAKNSATGFASYADLEKRLEAKISKLVLGHADALDSTPGKLGGIAKAGSAESPQDKALDEIQAEDGIFIENIINGELIPRMQAFGIPIPAGYYFQFSNDREEAGVIEKENATALACANVQLAVFQAGGTPDWKWFNDLTGMNVGAAPIPDPITGTETDEEKATTEAIKNLLRGRNTPIKLNGNGKH